MKIKLSKFKWFRLLNRFLSGNKPSNKSKSEKKKAVVEDKLRWEDDGGPILEANDSNPQVGDAEKQFLPD
jgi:hypothetical protein